jgi:hypothetical protein
VQTRADADARERFFFGKSFFDLREDGHERSGPFDLRTALIGEDPVLDVPELLIDELQVNDSLLLCVVGAVLSLIFETI